MQFLMSIESNGFFNEIGMMHGWMKREWMKHPMELNDIAQNRINSEKVE